MEKKKIISGQMPDGATNKSYEMNGSHTYGTSLEHVKSKSSEQAADHYDRDETCNAQYDKSEKHQ